MNPGGMGGHGRKRQGPCHKAGQQWLSCEPLTQQLRSPGSTRVPTGGRGTCCLDEGRKDAPVDCLFRAAEPRPEDGLLLYLRLSASSRRCKIGIDNTENCT